MLLLITSIVHVIFRTLHGVGAGLGLGYALKGGQQLEFQHCIGPHIRAKHVAAPYLMAVKDENA